MTVTVFSPVLKSMKNGLSQYVSLFKTISSLISIKSSLTQALILFDLFIRDITDLFEADFAFIQFEYQLSVSETQTFLRGYGLPEEQCIFIDNYVKDNIVPSNTDAESTNNYIYHINTMMSGESRSFETIRVTGVKTVLIVPILSTDLEQGHFSIYFTDKVEVTAKDLELLSSIGELLANAYINRQSYQFIYDQESVRDDYFWKSYEALFILDEDFHILDNNSTGKEILGITEYTPKLKLTDFVDQTDIALIVTNIQNLNIGDLSKLVATSWNYRTIDDGEMISIKVVFGFTKILNKEGSTRIIASGRPQFIREPMAMQTTLSSDQDIITKLTEFRELFTDDQESAAKLAKETFVPAAFALIVNEETGPMPLVSSPEVDGYEIMEETIRLMAGLNTDQIISQYYITGSSPWSDPSGELRWIAFSKSNPKARGNLEFHLMGIVIRQNLLTVLPQMVQVILGILLGGMNTYLGILNDDEADFVTKKFDGDRNFSTISIIREALDELRIISSEILGATLTGSDNL
ncbi:MAG: hypothetical protein ACW98K_13455 [Candidatus Kariarchaeaceae archaeon]|jgi:hypothetical protein